MPHGLERILLEIMACDNLCAQELRGLTKFTKFLALKSVQVIVQSRQCVKILPVQVQPSEVDWFNLVIPDNAQVAIETKKVLNGEINSALKNTLCVEISLKTIDGDEMLLETWSLGLTTEICDPAMKVLSSIYYRMGVLLKSLITITRITPAYKISRQQSSDAYEMSYKVYVGKPNSHCLGEGSKYIKIGQLSTPSGTLSLQLQYRTMMTISSINKSKLNTIMIKSDHLPVEPSVKSANKIRKDGTDTKVIDLNKPLTAGAFVDTDKIKQLHSTLSQQLPPELPMAWLVSEKIELEKKTLVRDQHLESNNMNEDNKDVNKTTINLPSTSSSKAIEVPNARNSHNDNQKYLKILDFPFADGSPIRELANFYQECLNARSLSDEWEDVNDEARSASGDSDTLSRQLKIFEDAVPEFDSMVASMLNDSENP